MKAKDLKNGMKIVMYDPEFWKLNIDQAVYEVNIVTNRKNNRTQVAFKCKKMYLKHCLTCSSDKEVFLIS